MAQNFLSDIKLGDSIYIRLGDRTFGDLNLYHNGTNSFIDNHTGNVYIRNFSDDKNIHLQSDDGSGGMTDYIVVHGSENIVKFQEHSRHLDNKEARFGTGSDLKIYHESSTGHSHIKEAGTGELRLSANIFRVLNANTSETMIYAEQDGKVQLRYNESTKFETTSAGINVTGTVTLDTVASIQGTDTGNPQASTDELRVSGYGIMGRRGTVYLTNSDPSGSVQVGVSGSHNSNPKLVINANNSLFYTNVRASTDSTYNLGSDAVRWANVYADNLYGIVDKLSVTANDTFTGTYSLLWHSGNVVYSSSFMTINGATDTLSVPNISTTGNVTVGGDLIVSGDTVTLNTETIEVEDNIIVLNKTQSDGSATASTSGIAINRGGSTAQASFIFDDSDDYWDLTHNLAVSGDLKVYGGTNGITVDTAGHASVNLDRASTSYDNNLIYRTNGAIKWRLWQDGSDDYLHIRDEANSSNMVSFQTGGNTTFAGNIGLGGATSPNRLLHIDNTSNTTKAAAYFYTNGVHTGVTTQSHFAIYSDNASSTGTLMFGRSDGSGYLLHLKNGATDRLIISNTGNATFAGNITTSSSKISVTQADGDDLAKLYQTGADGFLELFTGQATPTSRVKLSSYGDSYIAAASTGRVGIGTDTPAQKLDISGHVSIRGTNKIYFNHDTNTARYIGASSANDLDIAADDDINLRSNFNRFFNASTEFARLSGSSNSWIANDSNGKLGVGLNSPASTLHVLGPNAASGGITLTSSTSNNTQKVGRIKTSHYDTSEEPFTAILTNAQATDNVLRLGGGSGGENAATDIRFYTAANNTTLTGTERLHINESGNATFAGTVKTPTLIIDDYGNSTASDADGWRLNSTSLYGQTDGVDKVSISSVTGDATFSGYTSATSSYAQNFYVTSSGTNAVNRIDNDGSNLYITYGGTSTRALEIANSNGNATFAGDVNVLGEDINFSTNGFADINNTGTGAIRIRPTGTTTALTLAGANATVDGTLTVKGDEFTLGDGNYEKVLFDTSPSAPTGNGSLFITPQTIPGSGTANFTTWFRGNSATGTTKHHVQIDDNLTVGGNLYVTGSTTSVNVEDLNVEQGEITLNYAASSDTSSSADGAGIRIQDAVNATTDATMSWVAARDAFSFSHPVIVNATSQRDTSNPAMFSVQGGMSEFETTLTNNDDWQNSPISILERDNIGTGSTAGKYSPNLNFHWSGIVSRSLWMDSSGNLNYGEYDATGSPGYSNGFIRAHEMHAGVFKDKDSTGYYLDPANTGTSLNVAGSGTFAGNIGLGGATSPNRLLHIDNTSNTTKAAAYFYTNGVHTGVTTQSHFAIYSDNASSTGTLMFGRSDGSGYLLHLKNGATDRLIISNTGNATFAGDITAPGQYGESYSVDSTSGTVAIIDTVTLTAGDHHAVYEVVAVGNPNAAGSGLYRDIIFGKIIVSHGYVNPNVLRFIHFVRESPLPRDMNTSGTSSNLTMEVVFWDGSSESETFTSNSGTPTIRVKIDGYNSSHVGASTSVRLKRIM